MTEAGTDLNNYVSNGTYYFGSTYAPINVPAGSNGALVVIVGTNFIKQLWFRHGTPNSNDSDTFVRTLSSGSWSNWKKYSMEEDTGWIDLPLEDGIASNDNTNKYKCRYRKIGNRVDIVGCVKGITADNAIIATLPEGFRPIYQFRYMTGRNYETNAILQVDPTGKIIFIALTPKTTITETTYVYIQASFLVN